MRAWFLLKPDAKIFLAVLVFLVVRLGEPGLTFDEGMILGSVHRLFAWLGGELSTGDLWFGRERPSPAKLLAASGIAIFGETKFGIRIGAALLYSLAASVVYARILKPRGAWAALTAVLCLAAAPPLSAFAVLGSLESAAVALILISLFLALEARTSRQWIVCGLVCGVAIGTKITALLGLLTIIIWSFTSRPIARISPRHLALFVLFTGAGFVATWPIVIAKPIAVFDHVRAFSSAPREPALFFGSVVAPPWYYLPVWLVIGLPPVLLALAVIGMAQKGPMARIFQIFFVVVSACGILSHGYLREGLRHLLPLCAALAVFAGLGAGKLARLRPRLGALVFAILVVSFTGALTTRIAPNSLYISGVAGGTAFALANELPVTSSGDALKNEVLARLPDGAYLVVAGKFADRPLDFANESWRLFVAKEAARMGKTITFPADATPSRLLIFGSGDSPANDEIILSHDDGAAIVSYRPSPPALDVPRTGS